MVSLGWLIRVELRRPPHRRSRPPSRRVSRRVRRRARPHPRRRAALAHVKDLRAGGLRTVRCDRAPRRGRSGRARGVGARPVRRPDPERAPAQGAASRRRAVLGSEAHRVRRAVGPPSAPQTGRVPDDGIVWDAVFLYRSGARWPRGARSRCPSGGPRRWSTRSTRWSRRSHRIQSAASRHLPGGDGGAQSGEGSGVDSVDGVGSDERGRRDGGGGDRQGSGEANRIDSAIERCG